MIEEKPVPVVYDEVQLECRFRADLFVNGLVVVELKAKSTIHPVDEAQTLSHLRLLKLRFGLGEIGRWRAPDRERVSTMERKERNETQRHREQYSRSWSLCSL